MMPTSGSSLLNPDHGKHTTTRIDSVKCIERIAGWKLARGGLTNAWDLISNAHLKFYAHLILKN